MPPEGAGDDTEGTSEKAQECNEAIQAFAQSSRDAQIEAFLDQIEGETLGEMMRHLSIELESSSSSSIGSNASTSNRDPARRSGYQICDDISKLSRSAVDRYLDKVIFGILYRSAAAVAKAEAEEEDVGQNQGQEPPSGYIRRGLSQLTMKDLLAEDIIEEVDDSCPAEGHAQDTTDTPPDETPENQLTSRKIQKEIKDLQKNQLMAVHDALLQVLQDFSTKEEVSLKVKPRILIYTHRTVIHQNSISVPVDDQGQVGDGEDY